MIAWMFDSPARLRNVLLSGGAALLCLMMVLLAAGGGGEGRVHPTPSDTALQNPAPSATSATLPDETSEPVQTYGSSGPIALEAVRAFLENDRQRFATLASPEVVEQANEAPASGGRVTGNVRTLLGGPTQQQVLVPTSRGDLVLEMVISDGAWQVDSMEYAK